MFLKRKQRPKLKAKGCTEGSYHRIYNHKIKSSSDLVQSNTHKGCSMLNRTDYNYKLKSVVEREDDSTTNKWIWFNKQIRDSFLCSWMISRALVDYTDMGSAIGHILDEVYAPSVSMRDSIGSTTWFFYTSIVLHPGSDDHLCIHKCIHECLLSSSSKKQQNGKVSLNNTRIIKTTASDIVKIVSPIHNK